MTTRPLRVLTWHVHGNYMYYLSQTPCEFLLPVTPDKRKPGYGGRSGTFPWGKNVIEVPAEEIRNTAIDCVLFQSRANYLEDQHEILSEAQKGLPRIYIEHDPPREVPTDTRHIVDDPSILIVHVTHFNALMWNNNSTPVKVIPHGVLIPEHVRYTGEKDKGIVVINNIAGRGRRLGLDVFQEARKHAALDIVGMDSQEVGGLGEVPQAELPDFISKYRYFFNPIRYTSLGLAVCEAMMVGLPIVGLATTEMPVAVPNGHAGYVHTDISRLVDAMRKLQQEPQHAAALGQNAAEHARREYAIDRFTNDWIDTIERVVRENQQAQPKRA